jgi:hypothetical protein
VPWAALEGGVLMEQETGHFEPCGSITNSFPFNRTFNGQTFSDPQVAQTCVGGYEGAGKTGEGPCNPATGVCVGATTQGGVCPTDNFASGANCEFSDANCMPAGARAITVNGTAEMVSWPVAGCQAGIFQNGDLDFDGTPYVADWPDGSKNHPTSISYTGPPAASGACSRLTRATGGPVQARSPGRAASVPLAALRVRNNGTVIGDSG